MVNLLVPDEEAVKKQWEISLQQGIKKDFPYWTRLWPSSQALSEWLMANPAIYLNKQVLELAAGLGLPSFSIAPLAGSVVVSDYLPEALEHLNKNIHHLGCSNVDARLLNWHQLPELIPADVLLLSDVNYNPQEFDALEDLMIRYLDAGTTVIIATPHRISAAAFAATVLNWNPLEYRSTVVLGKEEIVITIWVIHPPIVEALFH
jgi:predicted nicotinamide N-methyase